MAAECVAFASSSSLVQLDLDPCSLRSQLHLALPISDYHVPVSSFSYQSSSRPSPICIRFDSRQKGTHPSSQRLASDLGDLRPTLDRAWLPTFVSSSTLQLPPHARTLVSVNINRSTLTSRHAGRICHAQGPDRRSSSLNLGRAGARRRGCQPSETVRFSLQFHCSSTQQRLGINEFSAGLGWTNRNEACLTVRASPSLRAAADRAGVPLLLAASQTHR